jgi:integrase
MLRVKDIDFERGQLTVRDPKGRRDRITMLPRAITDPLHEQFVAAKALHEKDLADGFGQVWLPHAIARKFTAAPTVWKWQWAFPAPNRWKDKEKAHEGQHHLHESVVQ